MSARNVRAIRAAIIQSLFGISALALVFTSTTFDRAAAQSVSDTPVRQPRITIGTGGAAGVYFVAGNSICRLVRMNTPSARPAPFRCAAPPSGGSLDNLKKLESGEVDFAIVQSDWHHHAYHGTSLFKGRKQKDLRSVFSLHVEPFQIIAGADTGIASWNDLAGKKVNIGNTGSGHRATFEELLALHKADAPAFGSTLELNSGEQAPALCSGSIDAFAFVVGVPNASVAAATDGCDGRIINLETLAVKHLIDRTKYYRWATIPKGTYYTTDADVMTFGVIATLVTRADVKDEVVDRIVESVFTNLTRFRSLHPAFAPLNPQLMATSGLSAPMHPAAKKRLQVLGLLK